MKPKQANKKYFATMLGASLGYIGSVFGVSFLHDKLTDGSVAGILLSLVPGLFICMMLLSVWQYLKDVDEVARHELTQSMMAGLFVLLALSGGWGLVELFNDSLPRLPVFWAFPVFFLTYGAVSAIRYRRCA